ncbi:hypothetical protein GAY28_32415 [Azospirillum brasilense]|nr:hypothetical protein [Azospirillum brasilense]
MPDNLRLAPPPPPNTAPGPPYGRVGGSPRTPSRRDPPPPRSGRPSPSPGPRGPRGAPGPPRLASLRRGSEGSTGLSGPKRYLWDEDAREDSWRFNAADVHGEQAPVATGVAFTPRAAA